MAMKATKVVTILDMEGAYTPEQLAALLQLNVRTVNNWRYNGRGPSFFQVGCKVRYPRAAVEAWIAKRYMVTPEAASLG